MKTCCSCKQVKDFSEFYPSRRKARIKQVYRNECKLCSSIKSKQYISRNREKIIETSRIWKKNNPDKIKMYAKNKFRKQKINPLKVLEFRLRKRLHTSLIVKNFRKTSSFWKYIGCSPTELKTHIESQFVHGMTWENRSLWHIDHILPLSLANTPEDLFKLSHYSNLRPLWAVDNLKKGSRHET